MENILAIQNDYRFVAGLQKADIADVLELESKAHCLPRDEIEHDANYLQLIPGVVLLHAEGILGYTRYGSEKRLQGKKSIVFGGHMRCSETHIATIERELKEELGLLIDTTRLELLGILYSDRTDVSRVHLGLIFLYTTNHLPQPRSDEIADIFIVTEPAGLEDWSIIVYEHLKKEVK